MNIILNLPSPPISPTVFLSLSLSLGVFFFVILCFTRVWVMSSLYDLYDSRILTMSRCISMAYGFDDRLSFVDKTTKDFGVALYK